MVRLNWGAAATSVSSVFFAALAACSGSISEPGGGGGDTQTGALCQGAPALDPGPSPIRRVTRLEYDNTVRDLLGLTTPVASPFPTEEIRLGFNNNASALSVSPALAEQYLLVAEQLATAAVSGDLAALVPCDPNIAGVDACGRQFIASFGQRAYRRPLDADDTATLQAVFDAGKATDFKTGVRLVIETALMAPRFLYRVEMGVSPGAGSPTVRVPDGSTNPATVTTVPVVPLDAWETASRLSYLLWHSMPDDQLFAAAEAGRLTTPADVAAQVQRMLGDPRARAMVGDFHDQWLRIAEVDGIEKDPAVVPAFSAATAGLMKTETQKFLDDVVWQGDGTLEALLGAPYTFVNSPLAAYYGIPGVSGSAFVKVALDPNQRAGLLTQGGLLSLLAKANQTSPIHRGKFVRERLLCQQLPPPPPNIQIKPPELSATLTTRQRFGQHSADAACSGCHHLMDPIGLGFEGFDGAGVLRTTENGQPVDTSGRIDDADVAGPFAGVLDLQHKLAGSAEVQQCVTTQWFRYAYGRTETDADACALQALGHEFAGDGHRIQDLLVALTESRAFLYRRAMPPSGNAGGVGP
jgi:hypothetical protein